MGSSAHVRQALFAKVMGADAAEPGFELGDTSLTVRLFGEVKFK